MKPLDHYDVIAFDCDGVILNSNRVKTDAFHAVTLKYGLEAADAFRDYHVSNGGVSRYKKFDHFFSSILKREPGNHEKEELLEDYAQQVLNQLMTCEVVSGLAKLRELTSHTRWMVASGGDQAELRRVFDSRNLSELFDLGIYGSPTPKDEILRIAVQNGVVPERMLMIGDSAFDLRASEAVGADFVFAAYWTEMPNWEGFVQEKDLAVVRVLTDIFLETTK